LVLISTELRFERRGNVGLQGANSEVFFAWDPQLNAELVVKQVPKSGIANPAEYFAEAALLYDTRHPNVVDVKYSCSTADHIFLAMPKYQGTLQHALMARPLTVREIVKIGLDMLAGLHHVHSKRLVHFDVKPSNVLIDTSGRAAVSDFGLTRPVDQHGLATPAMLYPKHLPPEYLSVSTALSTAADIYQAGLTLYRMCVGLPYFDTQFQKAVQTLGPNWSTTVVSGQFPNRQNYPAHVPNRIPRIGSRPSWKCRMSSLRSTSSSTGSSIPAFRERTSGATTTAPTSVSLWMSPMVRPNGRSLFAART
jgi:eukaryotic-like serine/threonine-protein kinase